MTALGTCSADGCEIEGGGSCIEGFSILAECPNFSESKQPDPPRSREASVPVEAKQLVESVDGAEAVLALTSGKALTVEEGHRLTGASRTRIVVMIGMVKSGKTTVLAELYERFCKGPYAGYLFAGSKTIIGFEQICYYSRAVSQRETEDTERTKHGEENNLLHLDLVDESSGHRQPILVSDLSGELFERVVEARENVYAIPYLPRADHAVLFVDAEKLGEHAERHLLINQLLVLMRACMEERRVDRSCRVTVVVSRHDLLPCDIEKAFLESMEHRISERVNPYFQRPVEFLDLAARPRTGPEDAYGLDRLLSSWLERRDDPRPGVPALVREVERDAPEIDKFAFKVLADET